VCLRCIIEDNVKVFDVGLGAFGEEFGEEFCAEEQLDVKVV
jgi:hypothetical protein